MKVGMTKERKTNCGFAGFTDIWGRWGKLGWWGTEGYWGKSPPCHIKCASRHPLSGKSQSTTAGAAFDHRLNSMTDSRAARAAFYMIAAIVNHNYDVAVTKTREKKICAKRKAGKQGKGHERGKRSSEKRGETISLRIPSCNSHFSRQAQHTVCFPDILSIWGSWWPKQIFLICI